MPKKRTKKELLEDLTKEYADALEKYDLVIGVEGKMNWRREINKIEKEATDNGIDLERLKKISKKISKKK